jgi:hypothetical protein
MVIRGEGDDDVGGYVGVEISVCGMRNGENLEYNSVREDVYSG